MFWIELIATVCGFICVVLIICRNIWCWPVGLVQVLLFIVIFYDAKLYSDLILHVIYVGMQIYGWHYWLTRPGETDDGSLRVSRMDSLALAAWIGVTALGTLVLGFSMHRWTDASLPYADAFTTAASLVAQYLLARKLLENWLFWIVVDFVAIGIYLHKDLRMTATLYLAFLILASIGLFTWRRRLHEQSRVVECAA